MPDNPELIEKYDDELRQLVSRMHKDGIPYSTICFVLRGFWNLFARMQKDGISSPSTDFVLQEMIKNLNLMAYCENWLAMYGRDKGLVADNV